MGPMVRRVLPRLLLVALVGGTFLPLGLARGQVGDVPSNPPEQEAREKQLEMAENPATVQEPEEGLQPASDGGSQSTTANGDQPTTANLVSVKVRTAECADAPGSETRLGLMKNSAAYSHCP